MHIYTLFYVGEKMKTELKLTLNNLKSNKKRTLFTLRSVGKKSDFTSEYQALKYVAYVFICFLTLVAIVLIRIVSFKLTIPMKEIKSIAD